MVRNKYISFILIVATTFLATGVGTFVTSSFKEPWYSQLILPSFNPPSWVFGPVWTTLYIMMALAVWLVWKETFNKKILQIYYIHLFFNAVWSVIFFGFHNIGLALIDLIIIKLLKMFKTSKNKLFKGEGVLKTLNIKNNLLRNNQIIYFIVENVYFFQQDA